MIREVKHYICDCCGHETTEEDSIRTVLIPVSHLDHHDVSEAYTSRVDLCLECYKKMDEVIKENFAEFEMKNFQHYAKAKKIKFKLEKDND